MSTLTPAALALIRGVKDKPKPPVYVPTRRYDPVRVIIRRPEGIQTLDVTTETVAALPALLQPFQVQWLLGLSAKTLAELRAMHPEWVVKQGKRNTFYSKWAICAYAKIPTPFYHPQPQA